MEASVMKEIVFVVPPQVQLLDLAGPAQAFYEAAELGANYHLRYVGIRDSVQSAQHLHLHHLEYFSDIQPGTQTTIVVAGVHGQRLQKENLRALGESFYQWLRDAHQAGVRICSICNASFLLAESGLLKGRKCTTHWTRLNLLQEQYPGVEVVQNRLYIQDGSIFTSAGISSGIDLALALIEQDHGPLLTAKVAQMLVIYLRRDGSQDQRSVFLDYRAHMNVQVHRVQDALAQNPEHPHTLQKLADIAFMSPRHLTRQFKKETGLSIKVYLTRLRMERAAILLANPHLGMEAVAERCGFKDARQLRRLWRQHSGRSPSASRPALN